MGAWHVLRPFLLLCPLEPARAPLLAHPGALASLQVLRLFLSFSFQDSGPNKVSCLLQFWGEVSSVLNGEGLEAHSALSSGYPLEGCGSRIHLCT